MSGPSVEEANRLLADSIPQGTDSYIGLFTTLPGKDGTGGIEVTAAWYSRKAHDAWQTTTIGGGDAVQRHNVGAVEIDAVVGEDITIAGWGIFQAVSGGIPRHSGPLRNAANQPQPQTLSATDQLRWADSTLVVQFASTDDQTESVEMSGVFGPVTTVGAVTDTIDIYTLVDEEAVNLEVELIARHTTPAGTDLHYYRKVRVAYSRDDGAGGVNLWFLHDLTPDGAATRITLTAATATIVSSGNNLRAQFTGEAGDDLTWFAVVRTVSDKA